MKVKNALIERLTKKESSTFNKFRALRAILRVPRLYENFQEAMLRKGQPAAPEDEAKPFQKNLGAVQRSSKTNRAPNFEINSTFFERAALCVMHGLHHPGNFGEEDIELLDSSPSPVHSEDEIVSEPQMVVEHWENKSGKSEMKRTPTPIQSKNKTAPAKPLNLMTSSSQHNFGRSSVSLFHLRENRKKLDTQVSPRLKKPSVCSRGQ